MSGFSLGEAEVVRTTEKSVLIQCEELDEETWIPISQIHDNSELYGEMDTGDIGEMVVKDWLATEREWV